MASHRAIVMGLRRLLRRDRVERELDDELRAILMMAVDRHLAAGLTREEAIRAACLEVGGLEAARENVRDVGWEARLGSLWQDLRIGARLLWRTPVVTIAVVLSLALGIGATTAVFSLFDSLLLRRLPVRDPDRLVVLADHRPYSYWPNPTWEALRDRQVLPGGLAAFASHTQGDDRFSIAIDGRAEKVDGLWVSGRFFDVLGVSAALGRTIRESDDRRGGGPDGAVAVISHAFWQRRFGGARDVVGRSIVIERVPHTIVGVAPPGFSGLDAGRGFDVAVPIGVEALMFSEQSRLDEPTWSWLRIIGRLAPGQTMDAAVLALRAAQPAVRQASLPTEPDQQASHLATPLSLEPGAGGTRTLLQASYRRPLTWLLGAVAIVLFITCANVANLLLARASAREHELSVRRALGASGWRLARQFFAESLLLSLAGAALGLVFSRVAAALLVSMMGSVTSTVFLSLPMDWRVLGFTTLVVGATTLLTGLVPACRTRRVEPVEALRAWGRGPSPGGRQRLGTGLVVGQVALSLVLVVAAAFFVRTFAALASCDIGFDRNRVIVLNADVQRSGAEAADRLALVDRLREAAAAVPGVASVAVSWNTPVTGMLWVERLAGSAYPSLSAAERLVFVNYVTPGFFTTYGTPLLAGRDLTDLDRRAEPLPVLVNQAFASRFLADGPVIGRTVLTQRGEGERPIQIVGLTADASYESPREGRPPTIYLPLRSVPSHGISVSVRSTDGRVEGLAPRVAAALSRVDPALVVVGRSLAAQVAATMMQERLLAALSTFFGGLAMLLAGVGIYGTTSYGVNRRRIEIGIRMALGASPSGAVRLILRRVIVLVVVGLAIGAVVAVWATRFVEALLFGVPPYDAVAYGAAALALTAVGLLAGWLPARRAARIDPISVMREP